MRWAIRSSDGSIRLSGHRVTGRVRIGVGRPPEYMEAADYVLSRFSSEEQPLMDEAIKRAADAVEAILKDGLAKAANEYNKKRLSVPGSLKIFR